MGGARDAQLGRHVAPVSEEGQCLAAVAVEAGPEVADELGAEVEVPARLRALAAPLGLVAEAIQLRRLTAARLRAEIEGEAVAAREALVEAEAEAVGILREGGKELVVLHRARLVGRRNKVEQPRGGAVPAVGGHAVAGEGNVGGGVVGRDGLPGRGHHTSMGRPQQARRQQRGSRGRQEREQPRQLHFLGHEFPDAIAALAL